jgi:hypothetical protein
VINLRRMRWAGHKVVWGERRDVYRIMRPLSRSRCRWEDNIKMDLQEVRCGVWTGSSWFRIGTAGRQ